MEARLDSRGYWKNKINFPHGEIDLERDVLKFSKMQLLLYPSYFDTSRDSCDLTPSSESTKDKTSWYTIFMAYRDLFAGIKSPLRGGHSPSSTAKRTLIQRLQPAQPTSASPSPEWLSKWFSVTMNPLFCPHLHPLYHNLCSSS